MEISKDAKKLADIFELEIAKFRKATLLAVADLLIHFCLEEDDLATKGVNVAEKRVFSSDHSGISNIVIEPLKRSSDDSVEKQNARIVIRKIFNYCDSDDEKLFTTAMQEALTLLEDKEIQSLPKVTMGVAACAMLKYYSN